MEEEIIKTQNNVACEAVVHGYDSVNIWSEIDYNFGHVDFGYPRTLEEVNAALDKADDERNDSTKWITSIEFHNRLEQKYPWLR
ncbi:MAG: hypothetical protein IJT53_00790 [Prevotella sp.]|nr:hypothetical protein [Prevotella sp.]